jgi:RecB family exonuclease
MDAEVFWDIRDWARAVARMPVQGPLPCRTVLVPRERVAHTLRRELIRSSRNDALAGTRFVTTPFAAVEVLRTAETEFKSGEEALRAVRLLVLFRSALDLKHFRLDLLISNPGWDEAFAHTISDLEGAGLRPADLEFSGAPATLRDVAAVWRALDDSAGSSWTTQRIYAEAAASLERDPGGWPFQGAVLATAGGDLTVAEARFFRSIPMAKIGLLAARPLRERYLDRMEALLGREAGAAIRSATAPRSQSSERDLLASYLFEPPSVLGDPKRPRSREPDETVDLEEHSGVEAELEATADWVARRIGDGIPLEDIAVLVPALDPLAGLVTQRLARLPWNGGALPVHVEGGLPLTGTAAGARALAIMRALRTHLDADWLAKVLPSLRPFGSDAQRISHGSATKLAWSLGIVGGNPAKPDGALDWSLRVKEAAAELPEQLARARAAEEAGEEPVPGRRPKGIERRLAQLQAIGPALDALVGVARHVLEGGNLATLWPKLRSFFEDWLLQPGDVHDVHTLLDKPLLLKASDSTCGSLSGDDALRVIEETINAIRLPAGRFGDPAVYVGSVRGAESLWFRAVRVIGLAEGHLPSVSREDPVIPDVLRDSLKGPGAEGRNVSPPTAAERALEDLQALDIVVRNAESFVSLSTPHTDIERSQREPSSVILEAAAALARPDSATGKPSDHIIPNVVALRRDAFVPARATAAQFHRQRPLGEASWQDGVSLSALGFPKRWQGVRSLALDRIKKLSSGSGFGPMDGVLGPDGAGVPVPGLTADLPTSASTLAKLLGCPHQFLFEKLLGFSKPAVATPQREIGQPDYGSLFHLVVAEFYNRHGTLFSAHKETLARWLPRANEVADAAFNDFLKEYPLIGEAVRKQQRDRLRRDLRDEIEYEWNSLAGMSFVAAERGFGHPIPLRLKLGDRVLFLTGRIDRLDTVGPSTLVRDMKTGGAYPRTGKEKDAVLKRDLQIAIYGLVAQSLAVEWKIPKKVGAAYTYVGAGSPSERSFRDDYGTALEPLARLWLRSAAGLLAERLFPRTADPDDCRFCSFRPVCGDGVYDRAKDHLTAGAGVLGEFARIKGLASEEEED